MKLYKGDCLEEMKKIESGSVDLVLTDPPYGNMNTDGGRKLGINKWDTAIAPTKIFEEANRVLRKNGKLILFAQEPYTTDLIKAAIPNVPFSYRATWEKDNFAVALGANKNMVSFTEDILIFSKKNETELIHPLRYYAKQVFNFCNVSKKDIIKSFNMVKVGFLRFEDTQFAFCPLKTYNKFIGIYSIDKMKGFKEFAELKKIDDEYKHEYSSTFNLWQGNKYKSNILKYKKDYDGHHPTQKPVLLLEDLIKTFSNEGNTVLDFTMGSGSTGVAAANTSREFIGIEQDEKYFNIATNRIHEATQKLTLFK